ncbi:hypothetical protein GCM10020331_050410 [Ectobacillus funiculus]
MDPKGRESICPFLQVSHLTKRFGGVVAAKDISMTVENGSITAVIGPNGAGKKQHFFNMITGVYKPDEGEIWLGNQSLVGLKAHDISKRGIARTFQNIRLFGSMTVLENVMVGLHNHIKGGLFGILLNVPSIRREEREAQKEAYRLLEYVGLAQFF